MSVWTGSSRLIVGFSDGEHGSKPSGSTEGEENLHVADRLLLTSQRRLYSMKSEGVWDM